MRRIGLFLALAVASPLSAQRIDDVRVAMFVASSPTAMTPVHRSTTVAGASQTSASTRSMVAGGIIGGVVGTFAGAVVGMSTENCQRSSDEFCGLAGGVLGGLLGEAIGVPVGVNWAANGRGTLRRSISGSIAMSAVCLIMGVATNGASVLMLPPMQIYTSIRVERSGKSGFLAW